MELTREVRCTTTGEQGMSLWFCLHGQEASVVFRLNTGWLAEWFAEGFYTQSALLKGGFFPPEAVGVFVHYDSPREDTETISAEKCEWRDGPECHWSPNYLAGDDAFALLVTEGHEAMWTFLEEMYGYAMEKVDQ